jgi:hypothetical protein
MSLLRADFTPGPSDPQDMVVFVLPDDGRPKKSRWTPAEDDLLRAAVAEFPQNWQMVARAVPGRSHKQCRGRWVSAVDPTLIKRPWTSQEDAMLIRQHQTCGGAWAHIARSLPGRSANAVKNRFVSLSNRLRPLVRHRPQMRLVRHRQQMTQTAPAEPTWAMEIAQADAEPASLEPIWMTHFPDPEDDHIDEMRDFDDWADFQS